MAVDAADAAPDPRALGRRTRTQQLADRLVAAIAVGAFSPGERLPPERELARLQDVSRVTVRDALKQVAELGLVEARRGRDGGTFVTATDAQAAGAEGTRRVLEDELARLADLFDYRRLIEGTVARTAAIRGTESERAALRDLLARFRATSEPARARELDRLLHGQVTAMTHNDHLAALCVELTTEATLGFASEPYPADSLARAAHEHAELVDAVAAGRAEEAARLATAHFSLTRELLEAGLDRARRRA